MHHFSVICRAGAVWGARLAPWRTRLPRHAIWARRQVFDRTVRSGTDGFARISPVPLLLHRGIRHSGDSLLSTPDSLDASFVQHAPGNMGFARNTACNGMPCHIQNYLKSFGNAYNASACILGWGRYNHAELSKPSWQSDRLRKPRTAWVHGTRSVCLNWCTVAGRLRLSTQGFDQRFG